MEQDKNYWLNKQTKRKKIPSKQTKFKTNLENQVTKVLKDSSEREKINQQNKNVEGINRKADSVGASNQHE